MSEQVQAAAAVYGPTEIVDQTQIATDGAILWTLPYKSVRGSQLCVSVVDTFLQPLVSVIAGLIYGIAGAEITIAGSVRGFESPIRRQFMRNITGPLVFVVPEDEPYNDLIIRARPFVGGYPGIPSDFTSFIPTYNATTNPKFLSIQVTMYVQAREGIGGEKRI